MRITAHSSNLPLMCVTISAFWLRPWLAWIKKDCTHAQSTKIPWADPNVQMSQTMIWCYSHMCECHNLVQWCQIEQFIEICLSCGFHGPRSETTWLCCRQTTMAQTSLRISAFVIHSLEIIIATPAACGVSIFKLVYAAKQADLSLTWLQTLRHVFSGCDPHWNGLLFIM